MDAIIGVRTLERSRHRLIHGERKRVLLVGPVHPDGADAVGIGDDHMLGHQVYPILSTSTATAWRRSAETRSGIDHLDNFVDAFCSAAFIATPCAWIECWTSCQRLPVQRGSSEPRLDEGAEASYGFADNQRVHFARAFIGIDSFRVGNEATDMVLEQDAVAAEQFARIADSLAAFDRGEGFRQRRMLVFHQSLVL